MAKETFSSQNLIPIQEIKKGIIILKNGSLRSVLEVKGINLDLKSSEEVTAYLNGWQQLLNHLEFSLEVVIRSLRININPYLDYLEKQTSKEQNELLKIQGEDYLNFVSELVAQNAIMKKQFFVVIPYDPVIIKTTNFLEEIKNTLKGVINLKRESFSNITPLNEEEFERSHQQLMIRQTDVVAGLSRLGLNTNFLTTRELIELFFGFYNPSSAEKEIISAEESENK
ncbi:MAG TPA: hypothetical protein PK119_00275 [Candidatus Paceibacterota bacterium]|nr:hypothetical protein [Candidatus Paceibacterota bacterium]